MKIVLAIRKLLLPFPVFFKVIRYIYQLPDKVRMFVQKIIIRMSEMPSENCFPSELIHTNSKWTINNWDYLYRGFDDESYIRDSITKVREYTMVTHDGLLLTYDIASYLSRSKIAGAFVETGVHRGGSAAMMAFAALRAGQIRDLHLFDSFEGIPNPTAGEYEEWMQDQWGIPREDANGLLVATGKIAAEQYYSENLLYNIVGYPKEKIAFHVGWFQDTVPMSAASIGPIALLRLDGDLYESTLVCLRHLYPLVTIGGFIIVDDYAFKGCRMACEEYFKEIGINPYMHPIDKLARYFVKT